MSTSVDGADVRFPAEAHKSGADVRFPAEAHKSGADVRFPAEAQNGDAPPSPDPAEGSDRSDTESDSGSRWLQDEIARRIAARSSASGGRHARRDNPDPSTVVGYVPRHSTATPGPAAPAPVAPRKTPRRGPAGVNGDTDAWTGPDRSARDRPVVGGPSRPAGGPGHPPARARSAAPPRPSGPAAARLLSAPTQPRTPPPGSPQVPLHVTQPGRPAPAPNVVPPNAVPLNAVPPTVAPPTVAPPDGVSPHGGPPHFAPISASAPTGVWPAPPDVRPFTPPAGTPPVPTGRPPRDLDPGPLTAPVLDTPVRDTPVLDTPVGDTPVGDTPLRDTLRTAPAHDPAHDPAYADDETLDDDLEFVPGDGTDDEILWSADALPPPTGPLRTPPPGSIAVPEQRAPEGPRSDDTESPKRVRVVLAERKGVARPVRTVVDIQDSTAVGTLLRSNLIGSQLRVAVWFAAGAGLTLGVLPLLFTLFPAIGQFDVLGLRLPWLLLGVLVYPFLLGLGWWHTRTAERVEQNFADHVQE